MRDLAGGYRLAVDAPEMLVLQRLRDSESAPQSRLLMAGEIVGKMTMLEIISVIANANWRGELSIDGEDGSRRSLVIDQGSLKGSRSNQAEDLLGEVLYRKGLLDRKTLDELLREITPDRRIGELCLQRNLVSPEHLHKAIVVQTEQVFFGALLVESGVYAMSTLDESLLAPAHTVHLTVNSLLMEGVQRIDEMALFRERIPSSELCPTPKASATKPDLDDMTQRILDLCDGKRDIDEIARVSSLDEFLTTKAIYNLLQLGLVELHSSTRVDESAVRRVTIAFNDVLRDIFMAVATYGGVDETRHTLGAWIQGSGYAPYFGEEIDEDGSISVEHVVTAMRDVDTERPLEALHQALHELVAFTLFSATTTLPRDQELVLARDVNRRLKLIRV
jgi:hypothetical protein